MIVGSRNGLRNLGCQAHFNAGNSKVMFFFFCFVLLQSHFQQLLDLPVETMFLSGCLLDGELGVHYT